MRTHSSSSSVLLEEKVYARVCQSHKRAPKVPVVDLDEAQRVWWGTRRKLRGIYLLKVLKWDQNWSKRSFLCTIPPLVWFLLLSYDRYLPTCTFCKQETGSLCDYSIQLLLSKSSFVFFVIDVTSELPQFFIVLRTIDVHSELRWNPFHEGGLTGLQQKLSEVALIKIQSIIYFGINIPN